MANITKNDLHALYLKILPYLNQQSATGGHTIENSSGTDLTDRDTLKFGGDLEASDDSTNEKTVVEPHELTNAEIAEIFSEIPITPASNYMPNTGFTPVGTIISIMGNHAPSHYLACDGTEYYISDYPVLAKYFEDEFGIKNHFGGNGTTTFAVPDLQGEFLRGTGTNSNANQGSGADVGVHQDGTEFPNIFVSSNKNLGFAGPNNNVLNDDSTTTSGNTNLQWNNGGGGSGTTPNSHYTSRPTNTSVLYCIATKNIYIDAACNYSLDEVVVGTWIDGKPIYQKVFQLTSTTNNMDNVDATSLNIDCFIDGFALIKHVNSNHTYQTIIHSNSSNNYIGYDVTSNSFYGAHANSATSKRWNQLIVQYTKTTD